MRTDKVIDIKGRQKCYNIWKKKKKCSWNREPKIADKNYSKIFLKLNVLKGRKKIQACLQTSPEHYPVPENKGIIPFSTVRSPTKPQKGEKHGTKWTAKRILVYCMRVETRRKWFALFNLSWHHQVTQNVHCSAHCLWMSASVPWTWIFGWQMHFSK